MYLTAEEARAFGIDLEEPKLQQLAELYSRMADEYCRTSFALQKTEWCTYGQRRMPVPCLPLVSVEAVIWKEQELRNGVDYFPYPEAGLVMLSPQGQISAEDEPLIIRYTYGYKQVPAAVKKVIAELIRMDAGRLEIGSSSSTVGDPTIIEENFDGEYSYRRDGKRTAADLQKSVLSLLAPFVQKPYQPALQMAGRVKGRLI